MPGPVQVAWLTANEELNREFVLRLTAARPELPLIAVSEFPLGAARWIPFHPKRTFSENLRAIRVALQNEDVRFSSILLTPRTPLWRLRAIAILTHGFRVSIHDRHLRAGSWPLHALRLSKAWFEWHAQPSSPVRRWIRRVRKPGEAVTPVLAKLAYASAKFRRAARPSRPALPQRPLAPGVSAIIPSRNGLELLRESLPLLLRQHPQQTIVVDNGSDDRTAEFLNLEYPQVEILKIAEPLSFAKAINAGLACVRHARVLLLNNDMRVKHRFLDTLDNTLDLYPEAFCATAQILFPPGQRREETGKAVLLEATLSTEFPIRCELPLPGEDFTWVLYGSGGCSLFDTAKFRALGGMNEAITPAYVEDLDLGFRAWQRGWPTLFRAPSQAVHWHRATTARYFTAKQLDTMVQLNYLRFLATAVVDRSLFNRLWNHAIRRLHLAEQEAVLREAVRIPLQLRYSPGPVENESRILALTNGDVAVFPGSKRSGQPTILIAAPYLPFPLAHGGAVRIYNLMREAAREFDLVLMAFSERWDPPPAELLALAASVVLVRRRGSHYRLTTDRPDTVEEFASTTFSAALRQTVAMWKPAVAQLEWTQMAQYAVDCAPARTVLVEHDITYDLYEQMAIRNPGDPQIETQRELWRRFETSAWLQVDRVVAMSEKDREPIGSRAITIPNGVDLERFQPSNKAPDEGSLLFVGSFAHHPNRSAMEWFLREVWPLLGEVRPKLHIIAGTNHEQWASPFHLPGVTVQGFVEDVRPAYARASVVIAPLVVSAGTNIKILEAMALGKAVVSTPAGVNGLEVDGVRIADGAAAFADAVLELLRNADARRNIGLAARACVERNYSWRSISAKQTALYRELGATGPCRGTG